MNKVKAALWDILVSFCRVFTGAFAIIGAILFWMNFQDVLWYMESFPQRRPLLTMMILLVMIIVVLGVISTPPSDKKKEAGTREERS